MPLLDTLISLVAPSQCLACGNEGPLLCLRCATYGLPWLPSQCFKCKKPSTGSAVCLVCAAQCPLRYVWARTTYQGAAKQLIHDYKFTRAQFAAPTIAAFMAEALPRLPRNTCLVPIPTATSRYRARGYDHAYLLAKALASQTGLSFCPILTRLGQTRQVGASKTERHTQLQAAFRITKGHTRTPPMLLVDDVVTTGASLEAAARALQTAGSKAIDAIAFAHKLN